jgi:hypothetical protein
VLRARPTRIPWRYVHGTLENMIVYGNAPSPLRANDGCRALAQILGAKAGLHRVRRGELHRLLDALDPAHSISPPCALVLSPVAG